MDQLPLERFELHDIKSSPISKQQLEHMRKLAGGYENLFSRRAMKYRALGLNELDLSEEDYRDWIMKEYTFLKRPVVILDDVIFIGSSPKIIKGLIEAIAS